MIAVVVILALLLSGTVPAAIALGYKAGKLKGDLRVSQGFASRAVKASIEAEEFASERIARKDLVIDGLKLKLQSLRDEMQNHPDPVIRGSIALDSVLGLLSEMQNTGDPETRDPDKAGRMPTDDGS